MCTHHTHTSQGTGHVAWGDVASKWGKQGLSSNVVIPTVMPPIRGKESTPRVSNMVLLLHPNDAERISRKHVQKNPRFNLTFGDSIIGTMNNEAYAASPRVPLSAARWHGACARPLRVRVRVHVRDVRAPLQHHFMVLRTIAVHMIRSRTCACVLECCVHS